MIFALQAAGKLVSALVALAFLTVFVLPIHLIFKLLEKF